MPYFKYLLDGCIRGLVDAEDTKTGLIQKKKKAKLNNSTDYKDGALSLQVWHLRALILSSLHKCFLYDAGSSKFLDSSNFQARQISTFPLRRYFFFLPFDCELLKSSQLLTCILKSYLVLMFFLLHTGNEVSRELLSGLKSFTMLQWSQF